MRPEVWCVIFCTLGTFALCEDQSIGETILRDMCKQRCPPRDQLHGRVRDDRCYKRCIEGPQVFEVSKDEEAGANARLVCRDVTFIILSHNPGVFVIERRPVGDTNWSGAIVIREPTTYMRQLVPGKPYECRIRRILASGFSKPEIIGPFESLTQFEVEANDPHQLKIDVSFSPSEDQSCFYEVTLWDHNNRNTLIELNATMDLRTTFEGLEFNRDYFVDVRTFTTTGIASPKTRKPFATPTCRDFHKNLILCKPAKVTGLNATMIRRGENIFDVKVRWNTPNLLPDYYEVHLGEIDAEATEIRNVSGNCNEVIFPVVKIVGMADVSIRAISPGGSSDPIYKRLKKPEAPPTFLRYIIAASLSIATVVIVGTGVYVCRRHGKIKPNVPEESHATFRTSRRDRSSAGEPAPSTLTDLLER